MLSELQIIGVVAGVALFGALAAFLIKLMQSKIKNQFLGNMLTRLAVAVSTAVKASAQTYADALKARNADGVLTPEEQKEAFKLAMDKLKSYVSLEEIGKAFGLGAAQAEQFAADQIEAAVRDLKPLSSAASSAMQKAPELGK
jgi:hypothetical protein